MMFNTTFNNISVISWWSVLLVEETGIPWKHPDLPQVTDKLYHIILNRIHFAISGIRIQNVIVDRYWLQFFVNPTTMRSRHRRPLAIIWNLTVIAVGRNTSNHACQICFSKSNCETMYHWFFLLEITVVKIMNNLNVCSAHSYLYPRSRFKIISVYAVTFEMSYWFMLLFINKRPNNVSW